MKGEIFINYLNQSIDYNPQKNYNQIDDNYIPPYRSTFPSVYYGIELEIHIVDHCNLNCASCNHFSPLAEPWEISLKDFEEQLIIANNNLKNIKRLIILGGEPTLHSNLLGISKIARKIFPNANETSVEILSNGVNIDQIIKNKNDFKELNILFSFCSYPGYTKYLEIEKIKDISNYFNTRVESCQTLVDPEGSQDYVNNFFNCYKYKLPCFTLKNNRLYICPFSAHIEHFDKKLNNNIPLVEGIDYLNIKEINKNMDIVHQFCFSPKKICAYCESKSNYHIFHKSYKDTKEYTTLIDDLYFQDYKRYDFIINKNKNYFDMCLNPKINPGRVDYTYAKNFQHKQELRFGQGKIDIIIPYFNLSKQQILFLKTNLLQQTIIKECVVYFISDNSIMESLLINEFRNTILNCVFLKTPKRLGPGGARNLGIKNSYNKYIFFLDADDYFYKETALEDMYNKINKNDYYLLEFYMYPQDKKAKKNKTNFLINRKIIKDKDIKYTHLFFGEDQIFNTQLIISTPKDKTYKYYNNQNIFAVYYVDEKAHNNLTNVIKYYDNNHFNLLVSRWLSLYYCIQHNTQNFSYIHALIDNFQNIYAENNFIDFSKKLYLWIIYQIYIYDKELAEQYFNLFISDLSNIKQIENELKEYIINNYLNNYNTKAAAKEMLKFLNKKPYQS